MKDNKGNVISDLKVTPLAADQINQPGSNSQAATGSGTASSTGTATGTAAPSATTSKSAAGGTRHVQGESMPFFMVSAVMASFIVGLLAQVW